MIAYIGKSHAEQDASYSAGMAIDFAYYANFTLCCSYDANRK